jgi:hypothetical protein
VAPRASHDEWVDAKSGIAEGSPSLARHSNVSYATANAFFNLATTAHVLVPPA